MPLDHVKMITVQPVQPLNNNNNNNNNPTMVTVVQPMASSGGGYIMQQPSVMPIVMPIPVQPYPSIDPNMHQGIEMMNPNPNPNIPIVAAVPIEYVDPQSFASQITTGTGKLTEYNHKNRCFPGSFFCNLLALLVFILFFAKVDWMLTIAYGGIGSSNSSSSGVDNGGFNFLGCYKPPSSESSESESSNPKMRRRVSTANSTAGGSDAFKQNEYVPAIFSATDSKYNCVDKFDRSFRHQGGWTNPSLYYLYVGCFAVSHYEYLKFDRDLTSKLETYGVRIFLNQLSLILFILFVFWQQDLWHINPFFNIISFFGSNNFLEWWRLWDAVPETLPSRWVYTLYS